MHNLFRVMLFFNDTMGYHVPTKKRARGEPIAVVPPREPSRGQAPELVDLEVNISENERREMTQ